MILPMLPFHPLILWSSLGLSLGLILVALWAIAIGDRARGRPRCPRCWYDMTGAPSPTCPECGHTARNPGDLLRARPRRLIAAASLAAGAAPVCWITAAGGWEELL